MAEGSRRQASAGETGPVRYGFFLVPGFAMMAFASVLEPLRAANVISDRRLYDWSVVTADGAAVAPSNGIEMAAHHPATTQAAFDRIVVCTGGEAHAFDHRPTFAWLRRAARRGTWLGAVADGSLVLARAGLLGGYRCTVHWQSEHLFRESHPDLDLSTELYVIDRDRFTSAGGTGAFDMTLDLIERDHDRALAMQVAEWFVHDRIRDDADRQGLTLRLRGGACPPRLLQAITLMEQHIDQPLTGAELARRCGASRSWLERSFRRYTGRRPMEVYMDLRLQHAHKLLNSSALPVGEVALACGFSSPSHFAKRYRAAYREAPRRTRMAHNLGP